MALPPQRAFQSQRRYAYDPYKYEYVGALYLTYAGSDDGVYVSGYEEAEDSGYLPARDVPPSRASLRGG